MEGADTEGGCSCKISRITGTYGFDELDDDLEQWYVREDASLRDLADFVNAKVVGAAIEDTGADIVGDPMSIYTAVKGDGITPERRANVRDQFTYAGIDLESLSDDFVSHQTVRDHLRYCNDIDTSRTGVDSLEDAADLVRWSRDRDEQIIDRTLQRIRRRGLLDIGDIEVTHTIRITCVDCGKTYHPSELWERGTCACSDVTDAT